MQRNSSDSDEPEVEVSLPPPDAAVAVFDGDAVAIPAKPPVTGPLSVSCIRDTH